MNFFAFCLWRDKYLSCTLLDIRVIISILCAVWYLSAFTCNDLHGGKLEVYEQVFHVKVAFTAEVVFFQLALTLIQTYEPEGAVLWDSRLHFIPFSLLVSSIF